MRALMLTPTRSRGITYRRRGWTLPLILPVVLACGSDSFKPQPAVNDPEIFWALELSHHAVTLSMAETYDTLRVIATPRNYEGELLTGLPAPQYVSRDPAKVAVQPDGTLVAVAPTSQSVWVVATLTTGNLRHRDSVFVKVVAIDPPPVLETFSVHPLSPDSAKTATVVYEIDGTPFISIYRDTLRARALNSSNVPLDTIGGGIPVYFRSSDSTVARIGPITGFVDGLEPGRVTVYASTTLFGVTREDALSYRIGYPLEALVEIGDPNLGQAPGRFNFPEWSVGVGAYVLWYNPTGYNLLSLSVIPPNTNVSIFESDVTFDEDDLPNVAAGGTAAGSSFGAYCTGTFFPIGPLVSDCNSGNIWLGGTLVSDSPPYPSIYAVRRFSVPGTYEYRSTVHGTVGRIVVVDEQE